MKSQQGFTLIELVVVVVLLGILAAAAIPRFVDLSDEAELAAIQTTANSLQSAAVLNFAQRKLDSNKGIAVTGADNDAVCKDTLVGKLMIGGWPSTYTLAGSTNTPIDTDSGVAFCKVTKGSNTVDDIPVVLIP